MAKKRKLVLNLVSIGGDASPYKVYNPILGPLPDTPIKVSIDVPEEYWWDDGLLKPEGLIWVSDYFAGLCEKTWRERKGEKK